MDRKRVMIIDDERSLRSLLKKVVPWDELGLTVAGEAESGAEAINTIDDIRPHIVFVDIRMPFMDGIEFSRIAKVRYPKLKIIVLTAYEEFDYARQCIGIGVVDYLLKPINRKDIMEVLRRVVEGIPEEAAAEKWMNGGQPDEISGIDGTGGQLPRHAMENVCGYLRREYQDPSMNLTSVAQEFGFHPSYLSRRFKEEIGKSLIDYLTAYRLEKAKELAKQGELMYMAADKTGIKDPNYFGKCFKKYMGVSYREYQAKLKEKKE